MNKIASGTDFNAILLVDKPLGLTSFGVVEKIRRTLSGAKVGHAGTLDPLATGLLILATGTKTRELATIAGFEKEYIGTLELGKRSSTFDLEGEIVSEYPVPLFTGDEIHSAFKHFIGEIEQIPPMFSAVRVRGKRLYQYARKGKVIQREPRRVTIYEFLPTAVNLPFIDFRVRCSKGTYIRTLVDDLGNHLGCGAVLISLRRTRVGPYDVAQAKTIDEILNSFSDVSVPEVN
ncbi:MAG: tRNA pseudouridine(55) synthase TruB [Bacteroidota bacterium]